MNPHRQFVVAIKLLEVSGLSTAIKEEPEDTKAIPVLLGVGGVAVAGVPVNQVQLHRGPKCSLGKSIKFEYNIQEKFSQRVATLR